MEINGQVVTRSTAAMITADTPITVLTTFKDLVEILKCRYLKQLQEVQNEYQITRALLLNDATVELEPELSRRLIRLTLETMEFCRDIATKLKAVKFSTTGIMSFAFVQFKAARKLRPSCLGFAWSIEPLPLRSTTVSEHTLLAARQKAKKSLFRLLGTAQKP